MAEKLDIINAALAKITQTPISSFNDNSPRAKAAMACYDLVLGEVMTAYEWSFCIKRVLLKPAKDQNGEFIRPEFGEEYVFLLPKDFLRKISVNRPDTDAAVEGQAILSDSAEDLKLRYLGVETCERRWPAHFTPCITARLAAELCASLKCGVENQAALMAEYELRLNRARHNDAYNKPTQAMPAGQYEAAHELGVGIGY